MGAMTPPSDAHRAQADALCAELTRQIAALDARAVKLRERLARYVADSRQTQIARVQAQQRATALERRKLIDLLGGLGHSHPCEHGAAAASDGDPRTADA